MRNDLDKADYYRHVLDECVVLAKTATSNEVRAKYYATAESYRRLADLEANSTGRSTEPKARRLSEPL
jgi:hypothetical protein